MVTPNVEPAIGKVHVVSDAVYADADGRLVADSGFADFGHAPLTLPQREAIARRIAACLNALTDVPTNIIEVVADRDNTPARLGALHFVAALIGELILEAMPPDDRKRTQNQAFADGRTFHADVMPLLTKYAAELSPADAAIADAVGMPTTNVQL